jgi:hypothetical protein
VGRPTIDDRLRLALELLSSVPYIKVGSNVTLPPCVVTDPVAICGPPALWVGTSLDGENARLVSAGNDRQHEQ